MLAIGSDHRGYALKERVCVWLRSRGLTVCDLGTFSSDPVDYPDIAIPVAGVVRDGLVDSAVLICGTGLGMAIAANKVPGIFAAPVTNVRLAQAARASSNAQIICLGAEIVPFDLATQIIDAWLSAEFQGGDSARKLDKIRAAERRTTGVTSLNFNLRPAPTAADRSAAAED